MIEIAIRKLLIDDPGISQTVGGRVIVDNLPQSTPMPAILLFVQSERALDALDGPLQMDQPLVRIACYAKTRSGSSSLRMAVRNLLGGFSGVVGGLYIKGIAQEINRGQDQLTDRVTLGTDQYRYLSVQDFRVTYDAELIV